MLTTFIFLTVLSMVSTNGILRSYARQELMDEMLFWGSATCQAGRRRSFSLHETPHTTGSRHLRDFFGTLITNVQIECGSPMSTKFNIIDDDASDTKQFNSLDDDESLTHFSEIVHAPKEMERLKSRRKVHLFPYKDVEVILLMVENAVQTLMDGDIFNNFNSRRHVLVFMISAEIDRRRSTEVLKKTFIVLLQRLWHERGILNVFFAAPFSSLGYRLWFYDPFFKNTTTGVRGQIYALGVESIPSVDRVKDLKGYTLNIGMFEMAPAAIKLDSTSVDKSPYTHKSQDFGGIDGITMTVIAEHMNFAFNIIPPTDGVEFGYVAANGTIVGTIGDAAYHRIDIGFNSMYAKLYITSKMETNTIELTTPIDFDRLCVIVPRAKKIPRFLRTFYHFQPAIWVCLVFTEILISLVWYLFRKFARSTGENLGRPTPYNALLLDTFLLFVGAPVKLNTSQAERMILSALLLLGVTVMGMFTGTLYQSFAQEMHYKDMNTLKEVDESGIDIGTASPNLRDVFGTDENGDDTASVQSLRRKLQVISYDGVPTIQKTAYRQNIASLSREHSFRVLIYRYVDDVGTNLLHRVEECPRSYYLSYVVPKDSVYIDKLNTLITRLQEAGLPQLWDSATTNRLVIEENAKENLKRVKSKHSSFNINDMQTSFFLLFIGHSMAISALVGEIWFKRKNKLNEVQISHRFAETKR